MEDSISISNTMKTSNNIREALAGSIAKYAIWGSGILGIIGVRFSLTIMIKRENPAYEMRKLINKFVKQRPPILIGNQAVHELYKSMLLQFRFEQYSDPDLIYYDIETTGAHQIKNKLINDLLYLDSEATMLKVKQLMKNISSTKTNHHENTNWINYSLL